MEETKKNWEENGNETCHRNPTVYFGPVFATALATFQSMRVAIVVFPQKFLSFNHEGWADLIAVGVPILASISQLFTYWFSGTICVKGSIMYSLKKLNIQINWNNIHTTDIETGNYIFILVSFMEVFIQLYPRCQKLSIWLKTKKNTIYPETKTDRLEMVVCSNVLQNSPIINQLIETPKDVETNTEISESQDTAKLKLDNAMVNSNMPKSTDSTRNSHVNDSTTSSSEANKENNDCSEPVSPTSVRKNTGQSKIFEFKDLNSFLIFIAITPLLIIYHIIFDQENIAIYIGSVFTDIIYFVLPTYWVWNSEKVLEFFRLKCYQITIHLGYY